MSKKSSFSGLSDHLNFEKPTELVLFCCCTPSRKVRLFRCDIVYVVEFKYLEGNFSQVREFPLDCYNKAYLFYLRYLHFFHPYLAVIN